MELEELEICDNRSNNFKIGTIAQTVGGIRRGMYVKIVGDVIDRHVDVLFAKQYGFDNYSRIRYCIDDLEEAVNWQLTELIFEDSHDDRSIDQCSFCGSVASRRNYLQIRLKSQDIINVRLCDSCLENKSLEIEKISIVYLSV